LASFLFSTTKEFRKYVQYYLSESVHNFCNVHVIVIKRMLCLKLHLTSLLIATRYGLDGPGIESLWRARLTAPIQTGHLYNEYRVSFPGVKWSGRALTTPEVKARVELYLTPPLGLHGLF
jgi:hypothetical protein